MKAAADDWKRRRLTNLGRPVTRIDAEHSVGGYAGVTSDCSRGLEGYLFLGVGAPVFIIINVCTSGGLTNEAVGEVVLKQRGAGR